MTDELDAMFEDYQNMKPTDEQNQTEYDAARAYLIKEGLDPDQLAKEGTVFIKAIHEQISLRDQLSKERETIKENNAWIAEERTINKELAAENRKLESELIEEREMRKELVVGLRKITSTIPNVNNSIELMMWNIANDLISKASELDKK